MRGSVAISVIVGGALGGFASPAAAAAEQYELIAYEAPGMLPFPGEVIIPDARKRIPPIVRGCGVGSVETIGRTDGVVEFRFVAGDEQVPCLKAKLPKGTQLRPSDRRLRP